MQRFNFDVDCKNYNIFITGHDLMIEDSVWEVICPGDHDYDLNDDYDHDHGDHTF